MNKKKMLTLVPFGFKSKKKPCEWAGQVGMERRALQWLCPLRNATVATVLPLVYSSVKLCWDAHLRACKNRHAVDLTKLEAEVRLIVTTSSLLSSSSSHLVQDEGPPHLILSFAPIAWWPSLFFAPPPNCLIAFSQNMIEHVACERTWLWVSFWDVSLHRIWLLKPTSH